MKSDKISNIELEGKHDWSLSATNDHLYVIEMIIPFGLTNSEDLQKQLGSF